MFTDAVGSLASARVKFRLAGGAQPLILLPVDVNDERPFQFALDTGTSTTTLSSELAKQLDISTAPRGPVTTGGARVEMKGGTLQALQVGGARIENAATMIGEFLSILSEAAGARLDGIIGYNFLRNYKVVIDYPKQMLSLFSP